MKITVTEVGCDHGGDIYKTEVEFSVEGPIFTRTVILREGDSFEIEGTDLPEDLHVGVIRQGIVQAIEEATIR